MAKLSPKEQELLDKLNAKKEAPDKAPSNRVLNVSIDLGDPAQVALAQKHGLLDADDDDADDDKGDKGDDDDDVPQRRGYFNE